MALALGRAVQDGLLERPGEDDPTAFERLTQRNRVLPGDPIVVITDVVGMNVSIPSIQVRRFGENMATDETPPVVSEPVCGAARRGVCARGDVRRLQVVTAGRFHERLRFSCARGQKPAPAEPSALPFVEATTAGAARDAALPLIVALHGLGDRPENFIGLFQDFPVAARVVAPHSRTPYGDGFERVPPSSPMSDESAPAMASAADDVARFIEEAARARPTLGKPIVTGFSQGGALSYTIAVRHAGSVAASVPISGWLPPPLWPHELPHDAPAIFAFHGTADARIRWSAIAPEPNALKDWGSRCSFESARASSTPFRRR